MYWIRTNLRTAKKLRSPESFELYMYNGLQGILLALSLGHLFVLSRWPSDKANHIVVKMPCKVLHII